MVTEKRAFSGNKKVVAKRRAFDGNIDVTLTPFVAARRWQQRG